MHKFNLQYIADTRTKLYLQREESKSHLYDKPLECLDIEHGIVLPSKDWTEEGLLYGGVCDSKGNFVEESGFRERGNLPYSYDASNVIYKDEEVLFIGFFLNCYGHGITDHIKKLWFLETQEYKNLIAQNPQMQVIYIVEKNLPLPPWQKEIFHLAGIDYNSWEQIKNLTCYKHIYIPENSLINSHEYRMFTPEFRRTIDKIKLSIKPLEFTASKIYFTRTGIRNYRRECGENRVEKIFRKKGFRIYSPENLTVEQQIALLMNCDEFASTEGSCAHNSIFCKPNTKVLILRKADYANSYQIMINEFARLDVTYIDIHHSSNVDIRQPWHGPFYMYVSPYLKKYFHLLFGLPYWLDPLYWVYRKYKWNLYLKIHRKKS